MGCFMGDPNDPKLAAQEIPEWFAFKSVARDPVDPQWQFS